MRTLTGSLVVAAWLLIATMAQGQDEAMQAKQRELGAKMRDLNRQMMEIRQAIGRQPELADARKAMEEAQRAMTRRMTTDTQLQEARKAADEAQKKSREIASVEAASDKEAADLMAQIKDRSAAMGEIQKLQQEAQGALFAIRRRIGQSPDLREAAEALAKAEAAIPKTAREDPRVADAAQRMAEARKALEEKVQAMPEKKTLDEAERAFYQAMQESPEAAAARQKRDEAMKAFEAQLQPKLAADPEGAAAIKHMEEVQQKLTESRNAMGPLQGELQQTWRRLGQENPKIAEGFKAAEEAETAFRDTVDKRAKDEKADLDEAQRAFSEKVDQKAAADPRMAELQKQLEALREQMQDLRR